VKLRIYIFIYIRLRYNRGETTKNLLDNNNEEENDNVVTINQRVPSGRNT
jgi:hypothetical protein